MARPRQISDAQIDAAARATFVERGPSAPVALVAERLGVSHAALLQRAGSKEKLLLRALRPGVPEVIARLALPPPPRAQAAARLEALLRDLLDFHERMLPGLMVLRAGGLPTAPPAGAEPPTLVVRRLLTAWLARAARLPRRRAAAVAEGILGAIEARCFNAYVGGPAFVKGDPRRFIHLLVTELVPQLVGVDKK
jgi:AcrR family transcriptional regulator